jgi:lipopolysaccharide transport system ATP-binding protein
LAFIQLSLGSSSSLALRSSGARAGILPMSSDRAGDIISVAGVTKHYTLYTSPSQRLLHLFMPSRAYPRFEALKGITFQIRRGETVGIIGQNGAGKSTLLQIVTGTVPPSSGEVRVDGRVAALLELGAGFEPDFTGRENIMLNGTILGLTADEVKTRTPAIIAFSELEEFIDRPVRTYSSGMFMRLAFSVAAHVDADVLIIDEALAVGDALFTQKCMRYLADFKQRGSILFVSHDLGAVTALCDRAIWLDHGKVRGEGAAAQVCEQYVAALFERPPAVIATPMAAPGEQIASGDNEEILFDIAAPPPGSVPGVTSCSLFNPNASSFGSGGAAIVDVSFVNPETNTRLTQIAEGQEVDLRILVAAQETVARPIFGFYVKDRLGQHMLGDNTFWETVVQVPIAPGERAAARFRFRWPALARGTYTVTVALADGTMAEHIQRHWLHDALILEVLSTSARLALIGVQMTRVSVEKERNAAS